MHMTFVAEMHEDGGWLGLRPAHMPGFDPLVGAGVAHDLMEHFPSDNGSVEAELQAFGAILHIRANAGWWSAGR